MKIIPNLQLLLSLILISLIFLGLDSFHLLALPKEALFFVANPIQYGLFESAKTVGDQTGFMIKARFAAKENQALKMQLAEILSENATLRTKLAETEAQLDQQQAIDPRTYKLIAARPIGLDRYLKLDKGSQDGVKVGQAVIFKDNFLGRVVQASEKSSNVELTADPDSKIAAFSINKNGQAKGVLLGQFGSQALMDKILHEEPMAIGDLVYSEGTEGYLPRGLILGSVSEIIDQKDQVFKQAVVKPVFDVTDLELVFVIQS